MQRWKKGLVVGAGILAGACDSVGRIAAPEASDSAAQAAFADSAAYVPHDDPPADTTVGRWGGYLGGSS